VTVTKTKVDELFEQALALSPEQREELADRLYQSTLPEMPGEDISPDEWERLWAEEIQRRLDQVDRGEVETGDAFEMIAEMRERLRARRQP
jgi:hypothetical protein